MFNVLPENLKRALVSSYRMRLYVVGACFFVCVELSLIVFLVPSLVISTERVKDVQEQVRVQQATELALRMRAAVGGKVTSMDTITETNKKLQVITSVIPYVSVGPLITSVVREKTALVHVVEFSYSAVSTSTALVVVRGIADNREALALFQKNLKNSEVFASVTLPVSDLAKDAHIPFSLTLSIMSQLVQTHSHP